MRSRGTRSKNACVAAADASPCTRPGVTRSRAGDVRGGGRPARWCRRRAASTASWRRTVCGGNASSPRKATAITSAAHAPAAKPPPRVQRVRKWWLCCRRLRRVDGATAGERARRGRQICRASRGRQICVAQHARTLRLGFPEEGLVRRIERPRFENVGGGRGRGGLHPAGARGGARCETSSRSPTLTRRDSVMAVHVKRNILAVLTAAFAWRVAKFVHSTGEPRELDNVLANSGRCKRSPRGLSRLRGFCRL